MILENHKVLTAAQNLVLQSKKHIEFLAKNAPEIHYNLESVAESMQALANMLEKQIAFDYDLRIKFENEIALKNQAQDK